MEPRGRTRREDPWRGRSNRCVIRSKFGIWKFRRGLRRSRWWEFRQNWHRHKNVTGLPAARVASIYRAPAAATHCTVLFNHERRAVISESLYPPFQYLTLDGLVTFTRLASHLKRVILQPQPIQQSNPATPPSHLPEPVLIFLGTALGIPLYAMADCWNILREHVWEMPLTPLMDDDYQLFKHFGWPHGITAVSIYPPNDCCLNSNCTHRIPLKKEYRKQAVIYTDNLGVQPSWNTSLYCPKCHTSYHKNYSVTNGYRTYYAGVPDLIQVGEHQFVETKLVHTWRANMLFGWFSASNTSRVYEASKTDHTYFQPSEWSLSNHLTTNQVWDAFVILGLL
ncbi:hypothetical protein BDZ97DRAFT_2001574 [Flammula alnicola]|nr:hypothetical protein BDZ97DRAFT_2001574 [Flammula alnicola]